MATKVLQTGGRILNRASGDVGNSNTSYVYFALTSHQFKSWSLIWSNVVATTITLEFCNARLSDGDIDRATAVQLAALDQWEDQTEARTGSASFTASNSYQNDEREGCYIGRVKLVTTNATNSIDLDFNGSI